MSIGIILLLILILVIVIPIDTNFSNSRVRFERVYSDLVHGVFRSLILGTSGFTFANTSSSYSYGLMKDSKKKEILF